MPDHPFVLRHRFRVTGVGHPRDAGHGRCHAENTDSNETSPDAHRLDPNSE
jgi:hypothetical protein